MAQKRIDSVIFSDLDMRFLAHPVTGALGVLTNDDAIKQAVKNTVLINKYERLGNADNYTDTKSTLFENIGPNTTGFLRNTIIFALKNFEPRVTILDVSVIDDPTNNGVTITIYYQGLNSITPSSVNMFLERVR